jgi:hypothetical protein
MPGHFQLNEQRSWAKLVVAIWQGHRLDEVAQFAEGFDEANQSHLRPKWFASKASANPV